MILAPYTVSLKNGSCCTIRSPRASDAEKLLDHLKTTAEETPFLSRYADEYTMTEEEEIKLLNRILAAPRDLMILAEVNGEIAGVCSFFACSARSRTRHRCTFGIAILKKYWNLGIGSAMFDCMLKKAAEYGFEQAELEVRARNERALALYRKKGFTEVGRIPRAAKHRDGTYDDDLIMICELKQES